MRWIKKYAKSTLCCKDSGCGKNKSKKKKKSKKSKNHATNVQMFKGSNVQKIAEEQKNAAVNPKIEAKYM